MAKKKKKKDEKKKKSPKKLSTPRGMHDILPEKWEWYERVETVAKTLADAYSFGRIETPMVEHQELFERSVGEDTDVVQKEMFALKSRGGQKLVLRPEGTAPVVRSYIEHGLSRERNLQKLWYFGPLFRYERPQSGRYRQFYQVGIEVVGGNQDAYYDAQTILMFWKILDFLRVKDLTLKVNSIGCRECREEYLEELQKYYKKHLEEACKDCERRYETNPLRLLDCKKDKCASIKQDAPSLLDHICEECRDHFSSVLEYLDDLEIPYSLDNYLVRGLDYYTNTVFEIYTEQEGWEKNALVAGGRYDGLLKVLGGKDGPAVGGALGVERVIELMQEQEVALPKSKVKRVFLVHVGKTAKKAMLGISEELRKAGINVSDAMHKSSMKAQLKVANKLELPLALILGQKELHKDTIIIRDLESGVQEEVPMDKLAKRVKRKLK